MTRCTNGPVSQLVSPDFGNGMTWSDKLEILLGKFNLKLKIGMYNICYRLYLCLIADEKYSRIIAFNVIVLF